MAMVLEKCPVCRARRSLEDADGETCPRCGADLFDVIQCYRQAEALRDRCRRCLAEGRAAEALALATRARFLVDEPETRRTLAAALLANRRVAEAMNLARSPGRA